MIIKELFEMFEHGGFNVEESVDGKITVSGQALTVDQCMYIAKNLGWLKFDLPPWELISKTSKFITPLRKHLKHKAIIETGMMTFTNSRRSETTKYIDRIYIDCPGVCNLIIIYGMPGVGGTYAVYDLNVNRAIAAFTGRTVKSVADWINGAY